jgi:hypothetical protein
MANLDTQLKEDRALRDAARRLVEADLGLVKSDVNERSVGKRATDLLAAESRDAAEGALDFAAQRPLMISGIVLAILAFLFRNSIIDLIINWLDDDDDDDDFNDAHDPLTGDRLGSELDAAKVRSQDNTSR